MMTRIATCVFGTNTGAVSLVTSTFRPFVADAVGAVYLMIL